MIQKSKRGARWKLETSFESLVEMMVEEDLKAAEKESILLKENLLVQRGKTQLNSIIYFLNTSYKYFLNLQIN